MESNRVKKDDEEENKLKLLMFFGWVFIYILIVCGQRGYDFVLVPACVRVRVACMQIRTLVLLQLNLLFAGLFSSSVRLRFLMAMCACVCNSPFFISLFHFPKLTLFITSFLPVCTTWCVFLRGGSGDGGDLVGDTAEILVALHTQEARLACE